MTSLPTWAVYLVTFGTPTLAFAGGLIGQLVGRRSAVELEKRSRREEVMRNLRWAAELAVSPDEPKAQLGVAQLRSLFDSKIIGEDEKELVLAALRVPIDVLTAQIEKIELSGEGVQVVEELGLPAGNKVDLPLEQAPTVVMGSQVPGDETEVEAPAHEAEDEEGES